MKYIILFRHAKAHSIDGYQQDSERELTNRGKESLNKSAPTLVKLLKSFESVAFVSSPYVRAVQTAEILASMVNQELNQTYMSIANGDYNQLVKDIKSTSAEAVVIVGHQPYLSEFAHHIASVGIPFEPASGACIELSSKGNKLNWMLNNHTLKDLSKD